MPPPDRTRRLTAFAVAMTLLVATPLAVVAADAFVDVPDHNVHHDDITWLKDNGVTAGCNPPANDEFCPGDPVLRQEMASFMRRLAENQVVDAATAQYAEDASTLDGQDPAAYRSVAAASLDGNSGGPIASQPRVVNSLTITVPGPGVLIVSGSAYLAILAGDSDVTLGLRPSVNGALVPGANGTAAFEILADHTDRASLAYSVGFEVEAGTHEVQQVASRLAGTEPTSGTFFYNANNLTAEWYPEGSVTSTLTPAGVSESLDG